MGENYAGPISRMGLVMADSDDGIWENSEKRYRGIGAPSALNSKAWGGVMVGCGEA